MSEMEKRQVVEELHKPARRYYSRRQVEIRDLDDTWSADLIDMSSYAKVNKNYHFILVVIDNFSKYAWAILTKTKSGRDVTAAMRTVLEQSRQPRRLLMYSTFSNLKACLAERFIRSLQTLVFKEFSFRDTYKWIVILPDLVSIYNTRKHRTIGMKPADATPANAHRLKKTYQQRPLPPRKKSNFKVGDKVRVSKFKQIFEKGFKPSFTPEIFEITAVKPTIPVTYRLEDYQNEPIEGGFYEELAPVKHPDVYLVEKVLKRRGNRLFVKWLGFDSSYNSWTSV